jgi:hypothetical protein
MKKLIACTSVRLGTDCLDYRTENAERSSAVKNSNPERVQINKQALVALRKSNFTVGDDNLDYQTMNKQNDPTGNMSKYTAHLDITAKNALRKSNLQLGTSQIEYTSTAQATNTRPEISFAERSATKQQMKKFVKELRSTNIQYGDETVSYLSSAQEQMRFDAEKVIPATISVDAQAALRTSSVTLGNDATGYSTSQGEHHKNKQVDTEFLTNASRMGADLKSKLSQTNYVLGDEKPDFTTTNSYAARKRKDAQRRNKQNLF